MPVQTIYKELSVLEENRIPIQGIGMQIASIVIHNQAGCFRGTCSQDGKWDVGRFIAKHHVEPICYTMLTM